MSDKHSHTNERTFNPDKAARLDDPARLETLPPAAVLHLLRVAAGMTVADIGAGTGYFAVPIADTVGAGRVVAVDFQAEMLEMFRRKLAATTVENIELIHGEARHTHVSAHTCDRVLIANVWHELDAREEVLAEMQRILRPDGMLAIVDWRADLEPPPGPPTEHRVSRESVAAELAAAGWSVVGSEPVGTFSYGVLAAPPVG